MLTEEQIARRKLGLGTSELAAAMGLSKWQTPVELYLQKRGKAPPAEDKFAFRFGHAVEPFILDEFERSRGVQLVRSPDTMTRGIMLAHLDAWRPAEFVVNAKTARNAEGWGEPGSAEVVPEYLIQSHGEMLVSGCRLAFIPVIFGGTEYAEYEIPFDAELGEMIEAAAGEFMSKVVLGTPPEPRTLADVNALYRHSRPDAIEANEEIARAWGELVASRKTIADAEEWAAERERRLKEFMGARDMLTYCGKAIATWRESKPSRVFDAKRFKAENAALAAKYEIERAGSRRFLLKD